MRKTISFLALTAAVFLTVGAGCARQAPAQNQGTNNNQQSPASITTPPAVQQPNKATTTTTTTTPVPTPKTYTKPAPKPTVKPQTYHVSIKNYTFVPSVITVKAGDTVVWTNNDVTSHTVTADDNTFQSTFIAVGTTYSHTFTVKGWVNYHCSLHPKMTGQVVVN